MQKNFIKNVEEPYRRPPTLKVYEYYTSSKPFGIADIGGKYLGSGLKKKDTNWRWICKISVLLQLQSCQTPDITSLPGMRKFLAHSRCTIVNQRSGSVPKLSRIFGFQKWYFINNINYSEQLLFLPFWPFFCLQLFHLSITTLVVLLFMRKTQPQLPCSLAVQQSFTEGQRYIISRVRIF